MNYLVTSSYLFSYLPMYEPNFLQNWLPRQNLHINLVEVHPQVSNNGHPVMVLWWALAHFSSLSGPFFKDIIVIGNWKFKEVNWIP
jgi:hypothetical protein